MFQIDAGLQIQHLAGMVRTGMEGLAGQQDQILRLVPGVADIGQQGGGHQRAGKFKEWFHDAGSVADSEGDGLCPPRGVPSILLRLCDEADYLHTVYCADEAAPRRVAGPSCRHSNGDQS